MSGQVVLITGAIAGIGRATALAFAQYGARVVVSGRRDDAGQALAQELRGNGAEAEFIRADVRHEEDVRNLVDQTVARFGRLDAAVNNAGTEGHPGPLTEQSPDAYAATFDTNVLGTLLSLKHELRVMQPQGRGSIVNLSSTMGHRAAPNASLYVASKHAVVDGLTKAAALEAAPFGVRVNAVAPGPIDRDAEPLHWQRRKKNQLDCGGAAETRRNTQRDRRDHRVSRVRQCVIHHRPYRFRRRRQMRAVRGTPSASEAT
ncbi:SDR family NAD(P)-dependent oxidoreductase [Methylocella sp.]|jgi:NAD(P)-dependent dehydrogenase (short-subunit alcohol dehydrogenase family)|uniref:SDR family NAD(P)-dependent oxidoreductase n=1 Tax=Methylocella sp. TaxID=1978226 RepID=UPI003C18429F